MQPLAFGPRSVKPGEAALAPLRAGVTALRPGEPRYPALVANTSRPPQPLFIEGELPPDGAPAVAVVGTRTPSAYGRRMARALASGLSRAGVWVISGLARGVDAEAHAACLDAGGRTVAVLGGGLDKVWPSEHKPLARRIVASGGGLLSQFGMDEAPLKWHFPVRNGLISALSLGVVVVEGARGSGSMITANEALDQGREVFAVPGLADEPLSQGPLDLLRDGACMARSADDILAALGLPPAPPPAPAAAPEGLSPAALSLWAALGSAPVEAGLAGTRASLGARDLAVALTELELRGLARRSAGRVARIG